MLVPVDYKTVLKRLLITWIVCFGCITSLAVGGCWLNFDYLPILSILLMVPIFALGNYNMSHGTNNCSLITHYSIYTLAISFIIIMCFNVVNHNPFNIFSYKFANPNLPFVSSLIVYPTAAVMFLVAILRRGTPEYCKACRERAGYTIKETLECNVFHNEAKYMLKLAFFLFLIIAVLDSLYFYFFYIDINLNSPDIFFFFICPTVVYILSIVNIVSRYSSLEFEVKMSPNKIMKEYQSMVRFIVIRGNTMLMKELETEDKGIGIWDTPAISDVEFTDRVSPERASDLFKKLTNLSDFEIRFLFATSTYSHNAFHFAIFIDDQKDVSENLLNGMWFNLLQYDIMLKQGLIARPLAYEIHRIYTMTLAWKTYDKDGKRLYPIKNYRPTFRLEDFKDWNLDYSDMSWIAVSNNNEDRPFFKIRKFWRDKITGADKKWRKRN